MDGDAPPPEVRVVLRWDAASGTTTRSVAGKSVDADEQLVASIKGGMEALAAAGKTDAPLLLDGSADVLWGDIVHVMDLSKSAGVQRLEFVAIDDPRLAWPGAGEKEAMGAGDDAPAPGSGKRLVVNVYHLPGDKLQCPALEIGRVCKESSHWRVNAMKRNFPDAASFEAFLEEDAQTGRTDPDSPRISERQVFIREDAKGAYGFACVVMSCCTRAGIYRVECGCASPPGANPPVEAPPKEAPPGEPMEDPSVPPPKEPELRELPPFVLKPPSTEQAECLARAIEAGYAQGDLGPLEEAFDHEALVLRAFAGLELSAPLRQMLVSGPFAELAPGQPGRDWLPVASAYRDILASHARSGSGLRYLRVRGTPEGPRLVFRLTRGLFLDYHEFVLSVTAEGKTRIVDVHLMSAGTLLTEGFGEPLVASANALAAINSLRAPTPGDLAVVAYEDPVTAMALRCQARDFQGALDVFDGRREALLPRKRAHLFRILAAGQVGAEAHAEAIHDARMAYPDEPAIEVVALAGYLRLLQGDETFQAINEVDKFVGGDSYLDGARAIALLGLGRVDEAERRAREVIDADSSNELAWLTLLLATARGGDFAETVAVQDRAEGDLGGALEALESLPDLKEYLRSDEYRRRREAHPQK